MIHIKIVDLILFNTGVFDQVQLSTLIKLGDKKRRKKSSGELQYLLMSGCRPIQLSQNLC